MKICTLYPADIIPLTAPAGGVSSDAPVLIGRFFGVPVADAAVGLQFQLATRGVFDIAKTAAQTFAEGDIVYWDDTAKSVTAVSAGNTAVGAATEAAAGGDATASVKIPLDARA